MTKVEFKKASRPLSEYAQKARKSPVIVLKRGKPFAAVVPIRNAVELMRRIDTPEIKRAVESGAPACINVLIDGVAAPTYRSGAVGH